MLFVKMIPPHSAITWDDFYRFCGNNFIGRKKREAIMREWPYDAGKALADLADEIGQNYIPANIYAVWSEFDIPPEVYRAFVAETAEEMTKYRNTPSEPYEYWKFAYDNCFSLICSALNYEGGK